MENVFAHLRYTTAKNGYNLPTNNFKGDIQVNDNVAVVADMRKLYTKTNALFKEHLIREL